jgi:hypothetical protein
MKILFPTTDADVVNVTRAREEAFTEFVKGYCHYSIGSVKGSTQISETIDKDLLFHPITVMDINIDVEYPGVIFQEF